MGYYARVDYRFFTNRILNRTIPKSVSVHYSYKIAPGNISLLEWHDFVSGNWTYNAKQISENITYGGDEFIIEPQDQCLGKWNESVLVKVISQRVPRNASNVPSMTPSTPPSALPSSSPTDGGCTFGFD